MSDKSSAAIFGMVFEELAHHKDETWVVCLAGNLWKGRYNYDFSPSQMCCDDALIALWLAKRGIDPEYPGDGETVLYKGRDYE